MNVKFWFNVTKAYLLRGFPLSHKLGDSTIKIGFKNRGLLLYSDLSIYEPTLGQLIKAVDFDFTFFDVGANVGIFSLSAINNNKCKKVIAFEPSYSYKFLELNLNKAAEEACKHIIFNSAVSDLKGNVEINHSRNAARDELVLDTNGHVNSVNVIDSVGLVKLLDDSEQPVFLKVDIEGGEENLNWNILLQHKNLRRAAIEVWNLELMDEIIEIAKINEFKAYRYDMKFEMMIQNFESPVNIYLERE